MGLMNMHESLTDDHERLQPFHARTSHAWSVAENDSVDAAISTEQCQLVTENDGRDVQRHAQNASRMLYLVMRRSTCWSWFFELYSACRLLRFVNDCNKEDYYYYYY